VNTALPLGDYNGDGTVNGADRAAWENEFGSGNPVADGNSDGRVNAGDFLTWQRHLGSEVTAVTVPEPTTRLLLSAFTLLLTSRRATSRRGNTATHGGEA